MCTMIWAVSAFTLICLVPLGHSLSPQPCEGLLFPRNHIDVGQLAGTWAIIGGNSNHSGTTHLLKKRDSITIHVGNFSFTQANRVGEQCDVSSSNFTLEGAKLMVRKENFNVTVTFIRIFRMESILFRLDLQLPHLSIMDVYLASKRRDVKGIDKVLLQAALTCLQLPEAIWMDGAKELCPAHAASDS